MRGRRAAISVGVVCALAVVSAQQARAVKPNVVPAGKIKHVVVIYQENRSFDEVLGDYCIVRNHKCDGSLGPFTLKDGTTRSLAPSPDIIPQDPPHNIASQNTAVDGGRMDGWSAMPACIMNGQNMCLTYYAPNQVPALTKLADRYAMSDRTFSMSNSPSWGGHLYVATGSLDNFTGDIPQSVSGVKAGPGWGCDANKVQTWIDPVTHVASKQPSCIPAAPGTLDPVKYPYGGAFAPTKVQHIPTIFNELDAVGKKWAIYSNVYQWSVCPNFADCLYTPARNNSRNTATLLKDARTGKLPAYTVINPSGPNGTGQHAPSSMLVGDNWIGQVVNAIRSGPEWSSTAIFITYDDCGCFYDHVPPGTNPDGTPQGIREPMVIVSPYAKVGYVDSQPTTFAGILRFAEESLGVAALTPNDAEAYDYADSFNFNRAPRADQVTLPQAHIPASTWRWIAQHPEILQPTDDT